MNKIKFISLIGIIALLFLQAYWLYNTYKEHQAKNKMIAKELFSEIIAKELTLRTSTTPKNPRLIIRSAKNMTPEERAQLKGDTILLKTAEKQNIGKSYAEIFMQRMQDESLNDDPPRMEILDSIFRLELDKNDIRANFQILFLNNKQEVIDSTKNFINKERQGVFTITKPIGTQGLRYMQAFVEVPPSHILENMLYSLIISSLIVVIVFGCLYYQLVVIRRTREQLQEREMAVQGAVHDLKSPLNATYSALDVMARHEKDEKYKESLIKGKKQIRRLTEIIESILALTKKHSGDIEINETEFDLIETIHHIEEELQTAYASKQMTLTIDNQLKDTTICTDALYLERCLRNLIENAIKYSNEKVEITVTLSANDKNLNIAVKDNGWGIPLQAQKKLGTLFYRIKHTDKQDVKGYGIGLNSVKFLLGKLGGKLTFTSEEGKGSIFTIHLPL